MLISAVELELFATRLLRLAGAEADEAGAVAASLVDANLCGHDSHGVVRIPDYATQIRKGELVPGAALSVVAETECVLVCDAQLGFGQVQSARMVDRLIDKARTGGMSGGTLRRCGHAGCLAQWAERIARQQMAALITVNDNGVLKCVAPPGGLAACLSTNPLAIGIPTADGPLVLDMSTSAVANGKLRVAHLSGQTCPDGWLQDAQGNSINDPGARFGDPPATILPMGGAQAYKGFGLALLLDILAGGLSGGFCPPAEKGAPETNNVLFVLWDPARFAGWEHFDHEARKLIDFVRSSPRKPRVDAIRLPGDRANACRAMRRVEGIPLDEGTWKSLASLAESLGSELPATSPIPARAR